MVALAAMLLQRLCSTPAFRVASGNLCMRVGALSLAATGFLASRVGWRSCGSSSTGTRDAVLLICYLDGLPTKDVAVLHALAVELVSL